jgi:isopentenyl-diphosphate delta-isomerase
MLGADVVALARPLLAPAIESPAAALDALHGFIEELRVCLHGCGAADLTMLRSLNITRVG